MQKLKLLYIFLQTKWRYTSDKKNWEEKNEYILNVFTSLHVKACFHKQVKISFLVM